MTGLHNRRPDDGFTVVEVIITMLLLMIVVSLLVGFLDGATNTTTSTRANIQAESDSQLVLRTVASDIRSAYSIETGYPATGTCPAGGSFTTSPFWGYRSCIKLVIAQPRNSADTCNQTTVSYGVNNGTLAMERVERRGTPLTCVSSMTQRTLLTGIVNDAAHPFLAYYDRDGRDLLGSPAVLPVNAASIRVTIQKSYRQVSRNPLTFAHVVALRNKR